MSLVWGGNPKAIACHNLFGFIFGCHAINIGILWGVGARRGATAAAVGSGGGGVFPHTQNVILDK